ncbi:MAG: hypothetical protein RLZ72_1221 [Actinomycetota bacterium]
MKFCRKCGDVLQSDSGANGLCDACASVHQPTDDGTNIAVYGCLALLGFLLIAVMYLNHAMTCLSGGGSSC